jgi:hypothetical protein
MLFGNSLSSEFIVPMPHGDVLAFTAIIFIIFLFCTRIPFEQILTAVLLSTS